MSEDGGQEGGEGGHGALYEGAEKAAEGSGWFGRALHMLHGAEDLKMIPDIAEMGGVAGGLGKAIPVVGGIASGVSGALNLGLAVSDFKNEGIHSDKGWEHAGGAALGGAGAALSCTPYGAALGAAEAGTDLLGKGAGALFGEKAGFSADKIAGGLLRGTVGDKSLGYSAGNWVSEHTGGGILGGALGGATAGLVNGIGMPLNIAKTVGTGLWDEGKAIWGGLNDKNTVAGKAVNAIGSGISSAGSAIGGAAKSAWGGIKSVGSAIGHFLSDERLKAHVLSI